MGFFGFSLGGEAVADWAGSGSSGSSEVKAVGTVNACKNKNLLFM